MDYTITELISKSDIIPEHFVTLDDQKLVCESCLLCVPFAVLLVRCLFVTVIYDFLLEK